MSRSSKRQKLSSQIGGKPRHTTSKKCERGNRDQQQSISWPDLPAHILREIYMNVAKNVDRCAMAQVCKSWHDGFYDPVLWRKMTFGFCSRMTRLDRRFSEEFALDIIPGCNAMKMGEVLSTYVKEVVIIYEERNWYRKKIKDVGDLRKFSQSLNWTKLNRLDIQDLSIVRSEEISSDLQNALESLIGSQTSLETLFIEGTKFKPRVGLEFLEFLADVVGDSVLNLSLMDFLDYPFRGYRVPRFLTEMQKFHRLSSIHINYFMLCDDILKLWAKSCPLLSYIHLKSEVLIFNRTPISCDAWRSLLVTNPNMLVEFHVLGFLSTRPASRMLAPAMPVSKIKWVCCENSSTSENELIQLLHCIANYHNTITDISLIIGGYFPNVNNTFVQNILCDCRKLLPFTCDIFLRPQGNHILWGLSQET